MTTIIPIQQYFRQPLPTIYGNIDYREFKTQLERMDEILISSGIQGKALQHCFEKAGTRKTEARILKYLQAFRTSVLKNLMDISYREFASRLPDSNIMRWFCFYDQLAEVKVPSKTKLQNNENYFSADFIKNLITDLNKKAAESLKDGKSPIGLEKAVNMERIFMDTTCVKTNIHFPVDWVLLRDGVRTLTLAIDLIRKQGLKHRMDDPAVFRKEMNKLCIELANCRRKKNTKKNRKKVLREMKKLEKKVRNHAIRYLHLLINRWEETEWTVNQMEQVAKRIVSILIKMPKAVKQANERIIGERRVKAEDKILSLYEPETEVIVRGKAGNEVEFGNSLLLCENEDGIIIDWEFMEEKKSDSKLVRETISRFKTYYPHINIDVIAADRGFDSPGNRKILEQEKIINAICPRSPKVLEEKLKDPIFIEAQKRRSQTEGRIGIFKNKFLGKPLRSKRFKNRNKVLHFCVLSHNLWCLARLPAVCSEESLLEKAS